MLVRIVSLCVKRELRVKCMRLMQNVQGLRSLVHTGDSNNSSHLLDFMMSVLPRNDHDQQND